VQSGARIPPKHNFLLPLSIEMAQLPRERHTSRGTKSDQRHIQKGPVKGPAVKRLEGSGKSLIPEKEVRLLAPKEPLGATTTNT
jgi:hypothetical protein